MNDAPLPDRKSLVLVVGAGASKEVNLPVGDELKRAIAASLDFRVEDRFRVTGGDQTIVGAFHELAQQTGNQRGDINPYLNAAARIRNAMPQAQSIDNFIDSHRSDTLIACCGKLAIVSCILRAERQSSLRVDRSNIYNKIKFGDVADTWFNHLFQLIVQSCQRDEVLARLRKIAVISFNYDRCLEHFLHGALQNYYSMTSKESAEALSQLDIFHPYGTVGSLPWANGTTAIHYGDDPHCQQLPHLMALIRTFAEGTDETASDIVSIRSTLRHAERVAFLGFAFHPMNLELLYGGNQERVAPSCPVYATLLGLSPSDGRLIADELVELGGYREKNLHLQPMPASGLFKEYSRSLSLQ